MKFKKENLEKIIKEELSRYVLSEQRMDQPVWFEAEMDNIMTAYGTGDPEKIALAWEIKNRNDAARSKFIKTALLTEPGATIAQLILGVGSLFDPTSLTEAASASLYMAQGDKESAGITIAMSPLVGGPLFAQWLKLTRNLAKLAGASDEAIEAAIKHGDEVKDAVDKPPKPPPAPGAEELVEQSLKAATKGLKLTGRSAKALDAGISAIKEGRRAREAIKKIPVPWKADDFLSSGRTLGETLAKLQTGRKVARKAAQEGAEGLSQVAKRMNDEIIAIGKTLDKIKFQAQQVAMKRPEDMGKIIRQLDQQIEAGISSSAGMLPRVKVKLKEFYPRYRKILFLGLAAVVGTAAATDFIKTYSDAGDAESDFGADPNLASDSATGMDLDTGEVYGEPMSYPEEDLEDDEEDEDKKAGGTDTASFDADSIEISP